MGTKSTVDQLNKYLRGELSAVETYRMALDKLDAGSAARMDVQTCLDSHQQRVIMLRDAIVAAGGKPSEGSGAWGAFAKAVEGSAKAFGDKATIAALEEGEDHGLKDYRHDVNDPGDMDAQARLIVTSRLLPEQQRTHDRLSMLKKTMS